MVTNGLLTLDFQITRQNGFFPALVFLHFRLGAVPTVPTVTLRLTAGAASCVYSAGAVPTGGTCRIQVRNIRLKERAGNTRIIQLDVTCFIISLFTAQHVSNVSTSIFRSL